MHDAHEHGNGIGIRLRAARTRRGLSREALAYHSGISWSAIAQAESGRRTNLRPGTLSALAGALGVTIDYLVAGGAGSQPMLDHRALFYESDAEYLAIAEWLLIDALERSESTLVVGTVAHARSLRRRLGPAASQVEFVNSSAWYRTPAGALRGYRRFLDTALHGGASWVRILGEPTWSGRSEDEVRLLGRYESLMNLVFGGMPVTVVCPHRPDQLDAGVLELARRTHPHVMEGGALVPCQQYLDPGTFLLG